MLGRLVGFVMLQGNDTTLIHEKKSGNESGYLSTGRGLTPCLVHEGVIYNVLCNKFTNRGNQNHKDS